MAPQSSAPPPHAAGVPGEPAAWARALPARVSVVGPGRLGTTLAAALAGAGVDVAGLVGRGEPVPSADAVILCVPDAEIPAAAAARAGAAPLVGHTSGATPLGALEPAGAAAFGMHPLQTFAGGDDPASFAAVGCAIGGSTPAALAAARSLAQILGMRPFELAEDDRATYHAAASFASNFVVTVLGEAEQVAAAAGLAPAQARALLAPLVRSSVENWVNLGPEQALTGPAVRHDHETIDRQYAAVRSALPELADLLAELLERTSALVERREETLA